MVIPHSCLFCPIGKQYALVDKREGCKQQLFLVYWVSTKQQDAGP
jgi:hypothetical protein